MDEKFLQDEDADLDERIASVENHVLELILTNSVELPPTAMVQDKFLVIGDRLYTKDQYRGIVVYDLKTGNPVSSIVLNSYKLKGMATDGKSLFLRMEGIDFKLKNSDIVVAKCFDSENEFSTTNFVGKRAEKVEGIYSYLDASKSGINGMIFPIPLELIERNSIMFAPKEYSEQKNVPRFLITPEMSIVNIHSGPGFINLWYSDSLMQSYDSGGCRIENNEINPKAGNLDMFKEKTPDRKLPWGLSINVGRRKVYAEYDLPVFDPDNHENDSYNEGVPIVFRGTKRNGQGVLELHQNNDLINILYEHRTWRPKQGWTIGISAPFVLESYKAELKELVSTEKGESKP